MTSSIPLHETDADYGDVALRAEFHDFPQTDLVEVADGAGGDAKRAHRLFDKSVIVNQMAELAQKWDWATSGCIAIDCGDRLELRTRFGNLPKFIKTEGKKCLLGKCLVLRRLPRIVADASQDPRFSEDPFVTGASQVRFFIGMPLIDSNMSIIGLLCLMSSTPRDDFSTVDCEELIEAAEVITAEYAKLEEQAERASFTTCSLQSLGSFDSEE